MILVKDALP